MPECKIKRRNSPFTLTQREHCIKPNMPAERASSRDVRDARLETAEVERNRGRKLKEEWKAQRKKKESDRETVKKKKRDRAVCRDAGGGGMWFPW